MAWDAELEQLTNIVYDSFGKEALHAALDRAMAATMPTRKVITPPAGLAGLRARLVGWRTAVAAHATDILRLKAAIAMLEAAHFDGHPILFADVVGALRHEIEQLRALAERFN